MDKTTPYTRRPGITAFSLRFNNALPVAPGRKTWLFAGSGEGKERAAILFSLMGTCRLNGVDAGTWLRYAVLTGAYGCNGLIFFQVVNCGSPA